MVRLQYSLFPCFLVSSSVGGWFGMEDRASGVCWSSEPPYLLVLTLPLCILEEDLSSDCDAVQGTATLEAGGSLWSPSLCKQVPTVSKITVVNVHHSPTHPLGAPSAPRCPQFPLRMLWYQITRFPAFSVSTQNVWKETQTAC